MSNGELPYRLAYAGRHMATYQDWLARATIADLHDELNETIREIDDLLRTDPLIWGDPLRNLRFFGLAMLRGNHPGLIVEYAVDSGRHIVYVARLRLAPWHPLYREGD